MDACTLARLFTCGYVCMYHTVICKCNIPYYLLFKLRVQHKPTTWVVTNAATASFSSFLIDILKYIHILHTDTYIRMHIYISRYTLYIVRQYILKPEVGSSKYLLVILHYLALPSCSFTVNALQF